MITGVPVSVSMEEVKKNLSRGNIKSVQRLKTTREGEKRGIVSHCW